MADDDDDESLVAVVAHGLLNDLTVVSGLLAEARGELPRTPQNERVTELLDACDAKTAEVVANLRHYAALGRSDEPPERVIDLDERRSGSTRPKP